MSLPAVLDIDPKALNIEITVGNLPFNFSTTAPIQLVNTKLIKDVLQKVPENVDAAGAGDADAYATTIKEAFEGLQTLGVKLEGNVPADRAGLVAAVNTALGLTDTANALKGGAPQLGGKKTRKHAAKKSHKKHKKHNATRHKKQRKPKSHK